MNAAPTRGRLTITLLLITTMLVALESCASAPPPQRPLVRAFVPQPPRKQPLRVLVLPCRDETAGQRAHPIVDDALLLELVRRRRFEVVRLPHDVDTGDFVAQLRITGAQDAPTLVKLGRSLGVDAVLAPVVLAYDPYDPPLLAVRAVMIDTRDGEVLWGAEGLFDARDPHTRARATSFSASGGDRSPIGPEIVLASARQYARFACAELAATLP